jgi:hypothetical protein
VLHHYQAAIILNFYHTMPIKITLFGDIVEHTGFCFVSLLSQGMTYPHKSFRQRLSHHLP